MKPETKKIDKKTLDKVIDKKNKLVDAKTIVRK